MAHLRLKGEYKLSQSYIKITSFRGVLDRFGALQRREASHLYSVAVFR